MVRLKVRKADGNEKFLLNGMYVSNELTSHFTIPLNVAHYIALSNPNI